MPDAHVVEWIREKFVNLAESLDVIQVLTRPRAAPGKMQDRLWALPAKARADLQQWMSRNGKATQPRELPMLPAELLKPGS